MPAAELVAVVALAERPRVRAEIGEVRRSVRAVVVFVIPQRRAGPILELAPRRVVAVRECAGRRAGVGEVAVRRDRRIRIPREDLRRLVVARAVAGGVHVSRGQERCAGVRRVLPPLHEDRAAGGRAAGRSPAVDREVVRRPLLCDEAEVALAVLPVRPPLVVLNVVIRCDLLQVGQARPGVGGEQRVEARAGRVPRDPSGRGCRPLEPDRRAAGIAGVTGLACLLGRGDVARRDRAGLPARQPGRCEVVVP